VPFAESALNDEAGKLFMEDYENYSRMAKLHTKIHATPQELPDVRMEEGSLQERR